MDRRRFLQLLAVAATGPAISMPCDARNAKVGRLRPDPDRILDLPQDYHYKIVSRAGDMMCDGLRVPAAHDGMAAFPGQDGRIILVCNHENAPSNFAGSAFADTFSTLPQAVKNKIYDHGNGKTPGAGGTTTSVYNPKTGETERQHLSLAGTDTNCAGGPTPWGSWLSCEECFESPGMGLSGGRLVYRDAPHGYVFEVPASAEGLVEPRPIKAMGKFEHEAAAVHAATGIVYMTEDRHHSLFYRYLPDVPGKLHEGGKLQCLAVDGRPSLMTHNWSYEAAIVAGESMTTRWIDLDDVDPVENDLRLRGGS
ncbi:MAG: PhoX family protein, partial [Gammaproteobacteria bacterium]|nr:PhoX family protein [Gammaproteobacteria bacterium]